MSCLCRIYHKKNWIWLKIAQNCCSFREPMRLSRLKISGFKSFADKTILDFKANRSAIVGPNGCGKSNVIDAIRWVMGESSARQLRGSRMQDIIFMGTATRKPVGMASVELHFDNTYGRLGGEYSAYTELAVRRQVSREGVSEYFLNGTRCRRRDITDIFLGTGLGPRSYAVIEQGMINRLVDAKPDEMRLLIEEASGVSKYQARRKETLQHLDHTAQNMSRLEDMAGALKTQLNTLHKQSEAAQQYQQLSDSIHEHKVDLLLFQYQSSQQQQQQNIVFIDDLTQQLQAESTLLKVVDQKIEESNQQFHHLLAESEPLKQRWQCADQKRLEISLQMSHQDKQFQKQQLELEQLQQDEQVLQQKISALNKKIDITKQHQPLLEKQLETAQSAQQAKQRQYSENQQDYMLVRQNYQTIKQQYVQEQQQQKQLQQQIEQLDKNLSRVVQQKEILALQSTKLTINGENQHDWQQVQQQYHDVLSSISLTEKILQDDALVQQRLQQESDVMKVQHDELYIQVNALVFEKKNLKQRLNKRAALSSEIDLVKTLQLKAIAKPHAGLIEIFLSHWLSADVLTEDQDYRTNVARQIKPNMLPHSLVHDESLSLADWIVHPQWSLWQTVRIVDTLSNALQQQSNLSNGYTLLSLDGYHIGLDWVIGLSYDKQQGAAIGVLSDQVRIEQIKQQLQPLQQHLAEYKEKLQHSYELLQQQKEVISAQQIQLKQQQQQAQTLSVATATAKSTQQAAQHRSTDIAAQIEQLEQQITEDQQQRHHLEHSLQVRTKQIEVIYTQYQTLKHQYNSLAEQQQAYTEVQQSLQQHYLECHQRCADNQRQMELLEKDYTFLQAQLQHCAAQIVLIQQQVVKYQQMQPEQQASYAEQEQYVEQLQQSWNEWQIALNHVQGRQNTLTQQRHHLESKIDQLRQQLEQKRLAWQNATSHVDNCLKQLNELKVTEQRMVHIDVQQHQAELLKLQRRFDGLGAVNLTAAAEYAEIKQRYDTLIHQIQDLEQTSDQLKHAMRRIDQETKKHFMGTFDRVNDELKQLFPKIFNGGEASLSLEDGWQSGVKLTVRPPGKRHGTLALLSGGEKSLTALALVFAIFRLNPAPFCVLDEVDAPLDDANVQRFCNLVKELSEQVQFIYITHNKLAMTMATDLLGVTMPELGTSKLVTVNLEQAKEYGLIAES